jgi:hypothetical protein
MFDVLSAAENWFRNHRDSFVAEGIEVHFSRTKDNRPKHSCAINLRKNGVESDVVLWDSGEAELGRTDADGATREDHIEDVLSEQSLNRLLDKMLRNVGLVS